MKRLFTFIAILGVFLHMCAQHVTFLGIPLGQSQEVIDRALKKKGFKYTQEAYEPAHMYEGAFWIYSNVSVLARTHRGKVTEIIVHPLDSYVNPQLLIKNLNKKYGKYKSIEKNAITTSYNWSLRYGNIQVTFDPHQYTSLRYIDNTSLYYYKLSDSYNRNKRNDL